MDINPSAPTFTISYTVTPSSGMLLDKVGASSGWTYGHIFTDGTCKDVSTVGESSPIYILCADHVNSDAIAGDSGSPVFQDFGSRVAALAGIVFARDNDYVCTQEPGVLRLLLQ